MKTRVALLCLLLTGCWLTPEEKTSPVTNVDTTPVAHNVPDNPNNPGLKIRTITKERIESGEIADVAYIGFEYDDWLEFAKWMHDYRNVNKELREVIKAYETPTNPSESTDP
ncbi:hypothetical protein [Vibrio phage VCPH]|nr:hypothetical protein [Vibrio phage VCPH]